MNLIHFHIAELWTSLSLVIVCLAVIALVVIHHRRMVRMREELQERSDAVLDLRMLSARLRNAAEIAQKRERNAIQERNNLREELRQTEERLALAADAARLLLFEWNLEENVELFGDVRNVFGVRKHEWKGRQSLLECVLDEDLEHVEAALEAAIHQQKPLEIEFRVEWPDGEIHWVGAKGSQSFDQGGRRIIGFLQNITVRKAAEEALVRNEKLGAAGRLAATIAHEVNNPLAAITNLLYIVQGDKTLSDSGRNYIRMAQQELTRAADIAKQTLGFYKENSEPVRVDVAQLLEEVLSLYAARKAANVRFERQYEPPSEIYALKGEIRQIFSNLVSNAMYALAAGGTLRVQVKPQPGAEHGVTITITDDGAGIAPEHLGRVFQPFFSTRKPLGTGLGLWVVQQIVEKHGGSIRVESSTGEGIHGTTITVSLPARCRAKADEGAAA